MWEGVGGFVGLNAFIFLTSLAAFSSPLYCRLKDQTLAGASALSCGLLVGCCLFIILPEGFAATLSSVYGGHDEDAHVGEAGGGGAEEEHGGGGPSLTLLLGFVTQLLVDVAIGKKGGGHGHHHHDDHHHSPSRSATHRQITTPHGSTIEADGGIAMVTSGAKGVTGVRDADEAGERPLLMPSPPPSPQKARGASSGPFRVTLPREVDPTAGVVLGLVLHCIADGIALGSSSLSSNETLRASVFLAMALHKIPVAFGTGALVHQQQSQHHSQGLSQSPAQARSRRMIFLRWALGFSVASPLSALITYLALGGGKEGEEASASWVGEGMLFSAGTFLFVTIGHILPELLHSPNMKGPQGLRLLLLLLAGLVSMFALASLGGDHDH